MGQRVAPGTILAKVAQPSKLKAELQIPETQAKDVALGQVASIDTRNGIIPGHVMRKDPAAINGTITVDVKLEGPLPDGARAGPERGRHHHDREAGGCGVRGTAGDRPGRRQDHAVQAGRRTAKKRSAFR